MSNNNNRSVSEAITDAIRRKALSLFDEKPQEEKKPSNWGLYLAWFGFNLIYLFLDSGTAWMVGQLTNPFYGVMTFIAGIGPFAVYEALFMRAWNNNTQKNLSIGGAAISIFSTVVLALIVGTINAITYFQITTLPTWVPATLEMTLVLGLVFAASVHGLIWIVYFFGDEGITRKQTHTKGQALRERKKDDFAMAQDDVKQFIDLAKIVDEYEKANQLDLLSAAFEKLTGTRLNVLGAPQQNQPKQQQPVINYNQTTEAPALENKQNGGGANFQNPPRENR